MIDQLDHSKVNAFPNSMTAITHFKFLFAWSEARKNWDPIGGTYSVGPILREGT